MKFFRELRIALGSAISGLPVPMPGSYAATFGVTAEQLEKADKWCDQHIKEKHGGKSPYVGAAGGAFGWKFISTGLGTIAIHNCYCGAEVNVTDFDSW